MTTRGILSSILVVVALDLCVAGGTNDKLVLRHRNPDGWFGLLVPTAMADVQRFADVDGGSNGSDTLKIKFDYWTFPNTPNFLRQRDRHGTPLACDSSTQHNHTWRTTINGWRALLQRCSTEKDGFHYLQYITFPRARVFDGNSFHKGVFNLTVAYKNERDASAAARIIRSVRFTK